MRHLDYTYLVRDMSTGATVDTFCGPLRLAALLRRGGCEHWQIERIHSAVTTVGVIVSAADVFAHETDVRAALATA